METMIRPGCFILAVIVIIAAVLAGVGLVLSVLVPGPETHQTDQDNR
jgi:hypothetical protein